MSHNETEWPPCPQCGRRDKSNGACGFCGSWVCSACFTEESCKLGRLCICNACKKDRDRATLSAWGKPKCPVCFWPALETEACPCSLDECRRKPYVVRGHRADSHLCTFKTESR